MRIADRARLAIVGVFLLTLPLLSWGPGTNVAGGDGHVIYAYVRSLLIDGDLHLENEYRHRWPVAGLYGRLREAGTDAIIHAVDPDQPAYKDPESRTNPNYGLPPVLRTPTGHVANQHAVGPALLWAPFFLLGHAVALGVNLLGGAVPLDGYSLPYTIAVGFGTALMALGAMLLAYAMLLRYVSRRAAAWAAILIYLASPLVVYAIQTPIAAHGPAAFMCALFLFLGLRVRDGEAGGAARQARQARHWLSYAGWGAAGGLMLTVRFESATLLALAGLMALNRLARRGAADAPALARDYGAFVAGLVVGVLPQMVAGVVIYGAPWFTFYPAYAAAGGAPGAVNPAAPHWWDVLWSTNKGLFAWHPVLLAATAGLCRLWARDRLLAAALLLALAGRVYVVGSWDYWHGMVGFGQRFFVDFAAPFMVGLGVLLEALARRVRWRVLIGAGVALAAWNIGLFVQYGLGLIPRDSGFAWPDVLYNQFVFLPRLAWQRVISPLSPWSLLVIASAGALLLLWAGWRRSRAQGGRKPC